jgi:hypothetical protein
VPKGNCSNPENDVGPGLAGVNVVNRSSVDDRSRRFNMAAFIPWLLLAWSLTGLCVMVMYSLVYFRVMHPDQVPGRMFRRLAHRVERSEGGLPFSLVGIAVNILFVLVAVSRIVTGEYMFVKIALVSAVLSTGYGIVTMWPDAAPTQSDPDAVSRESVQYEPPVRA